MEPKINESLLEQKLTELEKARAWSPRVISKLESLVRAPEDFQLFRVNPIGFGLDKNIAESEVIDLFLHASKVGLFRMNWQLICPGCSSVAKSFGSLKTLDSHFNCSLCQVDLEASLDDFIEVTFTASPAVRDIRFNHPESLSIEDYYFKYQFTEGAHYPDLPGTPLFVDAVKTLLQVSTYVEPGESKAIGLEVGEGTLVCTDRLTSAEFFLKVVGTSNTEPRDYRFKIENRMYDPTFDEIPPGKYTFEFENKMDKRAALFIIHLPPDHVPNRLAFKPYLQGKRLLVSQTFRDLFHSETIRGTDGLGVKDITILFTDLKGSTELYDRIGDLKAFTLVQQHFDRLGKVIRNYSGSIVKTIGDAIMASFLNPLDAVQAAILMLQEIKLFNKEHGDREMILKIGIHKGASIVVTLNDRLDLFGQTVNIASRVQGLANADEIYITQEIYGYPKVQELLAGQEITPGRARLKGIQEEMQVYKVNYRPLSEPLRKTT